MAIFNGWRITRAGVVFVVGIVILAGLVFGGVWFVKERGEQARRDEAIKIAEQKLEEQSEVAAQTNTEPTPAQDTQSNDTAARPSQGSEPAALPETGGELVQLLAVSLLALSGAFYVSSRRAAARL